MLRLPRSLCSTRILSRKSSQLSEEAAFVEVKSGKQQGLKIRKDFRNRNPRNLEKMNIAHRDLGWGAGPANNQGRLLFIWVPLFCFARAFHDRWNDQKLWSTWSSDRSDEFARTCVSPYCRINQVAGLLRRESLICLHLFQERSFRRGHLQALQKWNHCLGQLRRDSNKQSDSRQNW